MYVQSDTFQTRDGHPLGPLPLSHMRLGVVQAEGLYLDGGIACFWVRFRDVFEDEGFGSTKVINDNGLHDGQITTSVPG